MKAYLPNYNLVLAKNLKDALEKKSKGWRVIAGGTDTMVLLEMGHLSEGNYVSIWNLRELKGIKVDTDFVMIGAGSTFAEIKKESALQKEFPLLIEAAKQIGAIAIQNRATIGGNIINASPAADSLPPLICYDAELELTSLRSKRWIRVDQFFQGYKKFDLADNELLTRIRLPRNKKSWLSRYYKVGPREAQSISKVSFASAIKIKKDVIEDIRIALGSIAPFPYRARATEDLLRGKPITNEVIDLATDALRKEISPIDDIRSSRSYRLKVGENLIKDFLQRFKK